MSKPEIINTGDGSHSLYLKDLDETYHSRHGAKQESAHVFIKMGLDYLCGKNLDRISILEIGLGTGLNVWLTLEAARNYRTSIFMTSLEPFPIDLETARKLNYVEEDEQVDFLNIHEKEWEQWNQMDKYFQFFKSRKPVQEFGADEKFDLVFFDAFAPSKQPEMWKPNVLKRVRDMMNRDSVLVTYCAQGQFKRDLAELGFEVESLDGPPGKKEMVRATY